MKKFALSTRGCRTNQYETSAYATQLKKMGYVEAAPGEVADLCIVNTCTVTESADSHSRAAIRQLSREHPTAKMVVTGCMVEKAKNLAQDIPEIHHIVSNKEKDTLLEQIFPDLEVPEFSIDFFAAHTRAFLKVQDGCNSFCSYCIIPYVRGRSRSRTQESIVEEARNLIANGYKEIVVTGINVGDYDGGEKDADTLANLVRAIDALPGLERLRISSIDPDEVSDDLLDAVINGKHTCPSMHIVLQSGSNAVLKRMRRKYTRSIFFETCERLKAARPDFTFTTDIIVGFPEESDSDFADTLAIVEEVQFAKVHMFPYSDRPGTLASKYPNKVPSHIIKQRKNALLHAAEQAAFALRAAYVGKTLEVLTESENSGHTANFLEVRIEGEKLAPNQLVQVEILANTEQGLLGRLATGANPHVKIHRRSKLALI